MWAVVPLAVAVAAVVGVSVAVSPLAPLVLLGVVALVTFAWQTPLVAAVTVTAVVPALSGIARGVAVPGLKISELLLIVCAATVFLRRPPRWRPMTGVDWAWIAFAVVGAALALLHAATSLGFGGDTLLRTGLLPAFLFLTWWTASRATRDRADLMVVLRWVLLVSTIPALVGVMQYLDVPGVREAIIGVVGDSPLMPEPGEGNVRVTGPFPIAHSFGGYLLVPVVLASILLLRGDSGVLRRPLLLLVLAVDMVAVVLGVTVTILLWVPIALLLGAAMTRRLGQAAGLLTLAAVVSAVLFSGALESRIEEQTTRTAYTTQGAVPQTLQYRIRVWERDYLPLMTEAAPVGFGTDAPETVIFTSTENQYITLVLRGGLPLLTAAVVALGAVGVRAWRRARLPGDAERSAAVTVVAILAFLPVASMVWPYVTNAGLPQSLLAFAGAALAVGPRARNPYVRPARGVPVEAAA